MFSSQHLHIDRVARHKEATQPAKMGHQEHRRFVSSAYLHSRVDDRLFGSLVACRDLQPLG